MPSRSRLHGDARAWASARAGGRRARVVRAWRTTTSDPTPPARSRSIPQSISGRPATGTIAFEWRAPSAPSRDPAPAARMIPGFFTTEARRHGERERGSPCLRVSVVKGRHLSIRSPSRADRHDEHLAARRPCARREGAQRVGEALVAVGRRQREDGAAAAGAGELGAERAGGCGRRRSGRGPRRRRRWRSRRPPSSRRPAPGCGRSARRARRGRGRAGRSCRATPSRPSAAPGPAAARAPAGAPRR